MPSRSSASLTVAVSSFAARSTPESLILFHSALQHRFVVARHDLARCRSRQKRPRHRRLRGDNRFGFVEHCANVLGCHNNDAAAVRRDVVTGIDTQAVNGNGYVGTERYDASTRRTRRQLTGKNGPLISCRLIDVSYGSVDHCTGYATKLRGEG